MIILLCAPKLNDVTRMSHILIFALKNLFITEVTKKGNIEERNECKLIGKKNSGRVGRELRKGNLGWNINLLVE